MSLITLKMLADRLKLHPSTVSRALRNEPNVHPKTKKKVLALANQLDYRPNFVARQLKERRSRNIGVMVPEIRHDFFSNAVSGIERVAHRNGYAIILCQSDENYQHEVMNAGVLEQNRVAGLIVSVSQETVNSDHFKSYQRRGGLLVFFDRICEDVVATKIISDDFGGALNATEFLIQKGYRRIAHLAGPPELHIASERLRGYTEGLNQHHIPYQPELVLYGGLHENDGIQGAQRLLDLTEPPDAIFTVNSPVALGTYEIIKERGLKIPEDVGVLCFYNSVFTRLVDPPLTTVDQTPEKMGELAAERLLAQIRMVDAGEEIITETITVKTKLIVRASA